MGSYQLDTVVFINLGVPDLSWVNAADSREIMECSERLSDFRVTSEITQDQPGLDLS